MLGRLQTALKFLTYGIVIGILFAPDRGQETRRKVKEWFTSNFRDVFSNVTGGGSSSS